MSFRLLEHSSCRSSRHPHLFIERTERLIGIVNIQLRSQLKGACIERIGTPGPQHPHPSSPQTGRSFRRLPHPRHRAHRSARYYTVFFHDADDLGHRLRACIAAAGLSSRACIFCEHAAFVYITLEFLSRIQRKRGIICRVYIGGKAQERAKTVFGSAPALWQGLR